MADALAQARGLGVGLTLAHQHLAQLPANLRAAVFANARSRVCFQLAGDDAQAMARFSGGLLEANDFQRLRRYEAYAQLVVAGEVTDFASLEPCHYQPRALIPMSSAGSAGTATGGRLMRSKPRLEGSSKEIARDDEPVGRRRRTSR